MLMIQFDSQKNFKKYLIIEKKQEHLGRPFDYLSFYGTV